MFNFKELTNDEMETMGSGVISAIAATIVGACIVAPIAAVITSVCGGGEQETKAAALAALSACVMIGVVSPLP